MPTFAEVAKHNSQDSCWVIIDGLVYDVTKFLPHHPGGFNSILRYAGRDATEEYKIYHSPGTIERTLSQEQHLGRLDKGSDSDPAKTSSSSTSQLAATCSIQSPLSTLQCLDEFEKEAQKVLTDKAWIYYSSSAETATSYHNNMSAFGKLNFRPRVLRDVARVDMRAQVMSHDSTYPFFIAPAALAKLGHEDGELCLTRAAARFNIPHMTSTYSSIAHKDLAECLRTVQSTKISGALLFQLYIPVDKMRAKDLVTTARELGFKALVVTVDSSVIGKRDEDDRYKAQLDHQAGLKVPSRFEIEAQENAPVPRGAHSSTFAWSDLQSIKDAWQQAGPIYLKGIQTVEDAIIAKEYGVQGVYLSNHGGRQLDYAPSAVHTLLEIRKYRPSLFRHLEFYIDGGVRRGSDVVKALCLGARAVGLGRPFMYALSGYGTEGVIRAMEILIDEIESTMRLLGITDLSALNASLLNTSKIEAEISSQVEVDSKL